MISPDDPRLTAYADGALSPDEAARLERELAANPAARAEVERLRALQRALREAFAEETAEAGVFTVAEEAGEAPAPARESAEEVRRRRPYSIYRDAADAREEAEGWRPLVPADRRAAREHPLAWLFPGWLAPVAGVACVVLLVAAIIIPPTHRVRETAQRPVAASNLRQIGQASLIFAGENQDKLPVATDVWDYARQLAVGTGLNDGTIWLNPSDPAAERDVGVSTVLNADRTALHPDFKSSRPAVAVALAEITAADPATTPIAWTRGLQPDGTWAAHSPYGKQGGHILFLDGNVSFFRNLKDTNRLLRYDGKGMTSDIREALPPGTRIGEYTPTEAEQAAWARANRLGANASLLTKVRRSGPLILALSLAAMIGAGALVVYLSRRRAA